MVGFSSRDLFIDGGLTFTRPVYRQFSAGFGVWGGAQPGVYRVDAGPRVTCRCATTSASTSTGGSGSPAMPQPGSGPAVTLAGDF